MNRRNSQSLVWASVTILPSLLFACSAGVYTPLESNVGGEPSLGGASNGGSNANGGTTTSATGGTLSTSTGQGGSSSAFGGTTSVGGNASTGGAPKSATGGAANAGGTTSNGGTPSAGGTSATGGNAAATGGTAGKGGTANTGGASTATGGKATGGTSATGGASAAAGASFWKTVTYSSTGLPDVPSGNHNAGKDCLTCHTGTTSAPHWYFAGTVYKSTGTTAAPNVQVGVNDGTNLYTAYSGTNGNFYLRTAATINWAKAEVRIRNANGEKIMTGATPAAACNSCHTGTGTPRITAP